ncbi:MAG: nitroreductase [Verrucomicrobiales bacterium]|nr:nitroreductase [Verrucomicrobiales bacterium]
MPDSPKLDPISLRLAAANALIRRRRTIKPKDMSSRPIENEHLAAILENGNWAPTHGMTQPWRFFIFTEDGRQRLADYLQSLYKKVVSKEDFQEAKFEKLGAQPLQAPVIIGIGMSRQKIEKVPEIEEIEAVACAVQNMHLTASALGMAAFWSSPPICYTDDMRKWLGLGDERDKCLGFFYLGWPESEEWPESTRDELSEKVTWVNS